MSSKSTYTCQTATKSLFHILNIISYDILEIIIKIWVNIQAIMILKILVLETNKQRQKYSK